MKYLIIILLVQALLFVLLFSEKMKSKYVFISNYILFIILFALPHIQILINAIFDEDFSFQNDYFNVGFGGMYIGIWIISFFMFNILFPFLLSFLTLALHKSIFFKKTNSKY